MDPCADTDTDGDDLPDTLEVNCTTTLVADDDDDYDPSQAPADVIECNPGAYTYSVYSCTFTLAAGESVIVTLDSLYSTVYADINITGPSGLLESYGYGDYSFYLGDFGPYTDAGDYTIQHGSYYGYSILYSYATVTPGSSPIWNDTQEIDCGTDQADNSDEPDDMDGDGICDILDDDIDGDGTSNTNDAFPQDSTEDTDTDGDGVGDLSLIHI